MAGVPLAEAQRRLWQLIAAPSGVRDALREEGDPEGRSLSGLLRGDERLAAVDRLEIYANAYFYRIRDCLAEGYPALERVLGAEWFHDLVTAYLVACPPRHASLRFAGERLADFLAAAAGAPFRRRFPWAADLARLEWARVDAFDAADAPLLAREALAEVPPVAWARLRFAFQPALRLLELAWPVHELRRGTEAAGSEALAALRPASTRLAVWRADERVHERCLDPDEAEALALALRGADFGALCERLAASAGEREAPRRAAALLARWQAEAWISHLAR